MDYDLNNRFTGHILGPQLQTLVERVRADCLGVAKNWVKDLPEGREKSLAITKLEEAMFWANSAIARQGDVEEK